MMWVIKLEHKEPKDEKYVYQPWEHYSYYFVFTPFDGKFVILEGV